jgi:hypothetical protein
MVEVLVVLVMELEDAPPWLLAHQMFLPVE